MILLLEIPINAKDLYNFCEGYPSIKVFNNDLDHSEYSHILGIYTEVAFKLDATYLEKFKNLKFIATPTTSLTHIDLGYCLHNDIEIFSLKNHKEMIKNFTATAEVTLWHIFELLRKFSKAQASVVAGEWNRRTHITSTLAEKKIGIIGYGRLGARVAKIANDFEMDVYVYDIEEKSISSNSGITSVACIEEIFEKCEIISVHVDDRPANRNLIDTRLFQRITNPGTILINTSRGFVVNEEDAIVALEVNILGGLGVDVLQAEEVQNKDSNWTKKNLIINKKINSNLNISITPHVGGATRETLEISTKLVLGQLFKAVNSKLTSK
jgi:D-3-phosphoglycerate dehydrogenase